MFCCLVDTNQYDCTKSNETILNIYPQPELEFTINGSFKTNETKFVQNKPHKFSAKQVADQNKQIKFMLIYAGVFNCFGLLLIIYVVYWKS